MAVDLPEGSDRIPWIGYGRIRSLPEIGEWYVTMTVFGRIFFIAVGRYGVLHGDRRYRVRWWIRVLPNT